eukprot:COSAG01_NODE_9937_length_2297_cov_94.888990_2_plen_91_part_00
MLFVSGCAKWCLSLQRCFGHNEQAELAPGAGATAALRKKATAAAADLGRLAVPYLLDVSADRDASVRLAAVRALICLMESHGQVRIRRRP